MIKFIVYRRHALGGNLATVAEHYYDGIEITHDCLYPAIVKADNKTHAHMKYHRGMIENEQFSIKRQGNGN